MPFDIEKTTGTWRVVNMSDNLPQILLNLGDDPAFLSKLKDEQVVLAATVSGNTFTVKFTVMGKTVENTYTLGTESDERGITGTRQGKIIFTLEGDALVSVHSNYDGAGGVSRASYKWTDDNTTRADFDAGGLVGWYVARKV